MITVSSAMWYERTKAGSHEGTSQEQRLEVWSEGWVERFPGTEQSTHEKSLEGKTEELEEVSVAGTEIGQNVVWAVRRSGEVGEEAAHDHAD